MSGPRNPALLAFAASFPMPPLRGTSMRHKSGIKRTCFHPVTGDYLQGLKLHNHYLKPDFYTDPEAEYWSIRQAAALIDVTGEEVIEVAGPDALALIDAVIPRDLAKLADRQAMYCIMCYENGGLVEDAILLRFSDERLWWVGGPGASEHWLHSNAQGLDVAVTGHNDRIHVASLQGPKSRDILAKACDLGLERLPPFGLDEGRLCGVPVVLSRTGYTAELGYDIYVSVDRGAEMFDGLMEAVTAAGGGLAGSAALNLRRMEAGILDFGIDFDWQHNPYQIGLGWMVNFAKPAPFTGRRALAAFSKMPQDRTLVGLALSEDAPLCAGTPLARDGQTLGEITSAVRSPELARKIALGWVPGSLAAVGTAFELGGADGRAEVAKTPFFDPERKLMRA